MDTYETRALAARDSIDETSKTLTMIGTAPGIDALGIIARQRLLKRLLIANGLVSDRDGSAAPEGQAEQLWDVLELEAKAEVLGDILKAARGETNEHVRLIPHTATEMPDDPRRGRVIPASRSRG